MAISITSQINATAEKFQHWLDRTNLLINAVATVVVTANGDANGSLTTGNAYVNGTFAASIGTFGTIRGGNVQSSANLTVDSNVSVGNSSANVFLGYGFINVGSIVFINTSAMAVGGNARMIATGFFVGNSTVNVVINSSAMAVGGNARMITTGFFVGNSTVNVVINSTAVSLSGTNAALITARDSVANNNTLIGTRSRINFIGGSGISLNISDHAAGGQVNVQINSTAAPGGSNTHVLFNDSGAFGGASGLTYNKTTNVVSVSNTLSSAIVTANSFAGNGVMQNATPFWANTAGKVVITDKLNAAGLFRTITDNATPAWSMSEGVNFQWTLTNNRTLPNPGTIIEGRSGVIWIKQDGTGGRTLSFGNCFVFDQDTAPTINATANKSSFLNYFAISSSNVLITMPAKGVTVT